MRREEFVRHNPNPTVRVGKPAGHSGIRFLTCSLLMAPLTALSCGPQFQVSLESLCVLPDIPLESRGEIGCFNLIDINNPKNSTYYASDLYLASSLSLVDWSAEVDGYPAGLMLVPGYEGLAKVQWPGEVECGCSFEFVDEDKHVLSIYDNAHALALAVSVNCLSFCGGGAPRPAAPPVFDPLGPIRPPPRVNLGIVQRGTSLSVTGTPSSEGEAYTPVYSGMVGIDGQAIDDSYLQSYVVVATDGSVQTALTSLTIPHSLSAGDHELQIWDATGSYVQLSAAFRIP